MVEVMATGWAGDLGGCAHTGTWKIEIVRRCDRHRSVVRPKRWIVELSIGSMGRNRCLARDSTGIAVALSLPSAWR